MKRFASELCIAVFVLGAVALWYPSQRSDEEPSPSIQTGCHLAQYSVGGVSLGMRADLLQALLRTTMPLASKTITFCPPCDRKFPVRFGCPHGRSAHVTVVTHHGEVVGVFGLPLELDGRVHVELGAPAKEFERMVASRVVSEPGWLRFVTKDRVSIGLAVHDGKVIGAQLTHTDEPLLQRESPTGDEN